MTIATRPIVQFIMRWLLLPLVAVLAIAAVSRAAGAQSTDAEAEIRTLFSDRDQEIKRLLDEEGSDEIRRTRLKEVINGIIDFRAMGKSALGDHWNAISPQQQDSFVTLFSKIVRNQSISNLDIYRSKITYDSINVDGNTATVTTSTVYKDVPATVVYHLHRVQAEGGDWMAYDFVLDDVSTAEGYAKSFQSVIRKRGFETLMHSLNKKLNQIAEKQ